jgi:hypothetical protein
MNYAKIILIIFLAVFSGCSSFDISNSEKNSEKGIPFYINKARIKQTTHYSRSWITISLNFKKATEDDKSQPEFPTTQFYISPSNYNQAELMSAFNIANKNVSKGYSVVIDTFIKELEKKNIPVIDIKRFNEEISVNTKKPSFLTQTLISNTVSIEKFVDYSKLYYYNSTIPFFGSSTSSIELSENGTLSKASNTSDNSKLVDLASSLTGLFPIKELLTKRWGLTNDDTKAAFIGPESTSYQLFINVFIDGYNYELIKYLKFDDNLDYPPLDFSSTQNITMTRFADKSESTSNEDNNEIKFNGSVKIPE